MAVAPIPAGYHTVTPYLIIKDAVKALDFYKRAFNAIELFRLDGRAAPSRTPSSRSAIRR